MTAQYFLFCLLLLSCQGQVSVKQSCALGNWSDCEVETWTPCFTCVLSEYKDDGVDQAYHRYVEDGECADQNDLNCRNYAKMKFLKLTQTYICGDDHCGACFAECSLACGIPPFQDTEVTNAKKAAEYVTKSISYFTQISGHEEYSYEANVESWTGSRSDTKIWVKNDEIIARKRNAYGFQDDDWLEVGSEEVNSHEPSFPSETAPERIMSCANALNPERRTQSLNILAEQNINKYLDSSDSEFHAVQSSTEFGVHFMDGCVPILCYTVELNCADDCSTTYSLANLVFNDPYVLPKNSELMIDNGCDFVECDLELNCIQGWKKILVVPDECCPTFSCEKIEIEPQYVKPEINFPSIDATNINGDLIVTADSVIEEIPVSENTCTLTGGEIVQNGWSGSDTGNNYCNECACNNGGFFVCTEMYCGQISGGWSDVHPPQKDELEVWNRVKVGYTSVNGINVDGLGLPFKVQSQVVQGMNYIFTWEMNYKTVGTTELTVEVWDRPWINPLPEVTKVNNNNDISIKYSSTAALDEPIMLSKSNFNNIGSVTSHSTMRQENSGDSDFLPYSATWNRNYGTEVKPVSNIILETMHGREITVISCPQNQELTTCGTSCPKICGQPEIQICIALCLTNVCQCPAGLWLDSLTGLCVKQRNCPRQATFTSQYLKSSGPLHGGTKENLMEDVWFWCFIATFTLICCLAFVGCYKNLSFSKSKQENNTPFLPKSSDVILDENLKPARI